MKKGTKKMKKEKMVLIALLSMALILTNVMSIGIQVLVVEAKTEQKNVDESQNVADTMDEVDNDLSNDNIKNEDSNLENQEHENGEDDENVDPEKPISENAEQVEFKDEETEGDSGENEIRASQKEEQEIPDDMEENINDEKDIDAEGILALCAEERLALLSSDDDIASGTYGDITWVIDGNGKLTVLGSGDFHDSTDSIYRAPWHSSSSIIKSAEINVAGITDTSFMFYSCNNLTDIDMKNFDTSEVMNMKCMFSFCPSLIDLDLSGFDTSNVTDMSCMFKGCSLESLDLSRFNTDNVTTMEEMFCGCGQLNAIDLSSFNTSKVTDMSRMFENCNGLTTLDLSSFDTRNVTNMAFMFKDCSNIITLDLNSFNTSSVVTMTGMFEYCGNLISLDLSNFNTSQVTSMAVMFTSCKNLSDLSINSFNTSKVASMGSMFEGCRSLIRLDLSNFDTSNVKDMNYMFTNCNQLISLDLRSFNMSSISEYLHIFQGCTSLVEIYAPYHAKGGCELPSESGDIWYLADGTEVTVLPSFLGYSVVVMRNQIPTEDIPEKDLTDDAMKYVQNLTQVSLQNADAESKKSIENAIYNLLFKAEYSPMKSEIPGDTMTFVGTKEVIARWPIQNKDYNTQAYWNRTVNDSKLGTVKFNNAGAGCMAYAYFATTYTYGINGSAKKCSNISADGIKEFIRQYADPGEHLRYEKPHSLVFLGESSDGKGFYYISYEGGVSKRGTYHLLRLMYKSYEKFESEVAGKLSIYDANNGSYYNGTAKTVADVRNRKGVEKIVARLACPVEATIEFNEEILDSRNLGITSYGSVERDGDEIIFTLDYSPDYNFSIIGTGEGAMTLTLEYYDNTNVLVDKRVFVNVPIENSTDIQASGFDSQSDFVLYVSDDINKTETWGAGTGETVYGPDNMYRSDNNSEYDESEDDETKDNEESGILPDDIPSDGIIPDGIWSAGIIDTVYTGSNITQSFRLYDSNKRLQEKVDYTVSYKNNKTAYTYTEEDYAEFESNLQSTGKSVKFGTFDPKKAPQIVIKMNGNYSGSRTIYFRIQPANITDDGFIASDLAVTYSGKKQTPAPNVKWNGKALKYNTDFYIPEYDNAKNDKTAFSKSVSYDLTIVGKNNFTGEIPTTLTISGSSNQIAMSDVAVKGVSNQVWTGQQIIPEGYTVKYKTDVLSEANGDYTVSLGENTAVGSGTITLTGTGTDNDEDGYSYIGTKTISFKLTGTAMSKVTVSGVDKSYTYTGTAIEPNAILTFKANKNSAPITLVKDTHYTVAYQRNQDTGTATIVFTGLESGGYTGTKKITFKIAASGITDKTECGNSVEQIQIAYKDAGNIQEGIYVAPYMKGGAKPEVIVTSGSKTLKSGKDYTISYANNKKIALSTDKAAPTITIKGKGNYSGSKKVTFSIAVKPLSEENGIIVTAKDKVVSMKKNGYRQSFKVYDADGKALGSSDYDSKNVIYTLIQTKNEDGTTNDVNEVLDQNSIVPADSVIRIIVQGKGNYAGGSVSGTYRILEANHDISKATIQINNQEYTGQPVMITDQSQFKSNKVYIKIGKVTKILTLGEDIEVVPDSYVKNVNKGTAKVTFRGINDFGGTKSVSYKIGARSIADFWKGIFSKITELMAYNEVRIAFPKYVARMA